MLTLDAWCDFIILDQCSVHWVLNLHKFNKIALRLDYWNMDMTEVLSGLVS